MEKLTLSFNYKAPKSNIGYGFIVGQVLETGERLPITLDLWWDFFITPGLVSNRTLSGVITVPSELLYDLGFEVNLDAEKVAV